MSSHEMHEHELGGKDIASEATFDHATAILSQDQRLRREFKARHITMIAIGGAIGNGLIIGTGAALAKAGPAPILISYSVIGLLVYIVMTALGEMATWLPHGKGFSGLASAFVDPALGFGLGWTYWIKYCITTPNQLTASALVIQYWVDRTRVNPGVFIAIFLILAMIVNLLGPRYFGEIEFWMSAIKITVLLGLMILSLVLALGGGPTSDRTGFRYWSDPGAFRDYITTGSSGRFLAVWASLVTATLAYLGTEIVGVAAGEAHNPRRSIPKAIKLTFWRILVFYILSVLLLGMAVPYDSKELAFANKQSTSAAASPFVVAIQIAQIHVLPGFINGCILVFLLSAANTDLYIASRTLYGLAIDGLAPQIFARTNSRGVPVVALSASAAFSLLAFMNVSNDSKVVFKYFVNSITTFGILCWISILLTHIYFVRARVAQNIPVSDLAYKAPFGARGSTVSLVILCVIVLTKNFDVFVSSQRTGGAYGSFDWKNFITGYIGIPVYLALIFGYKFIVGSTRVDVNTVDLYRLRQPIDQEAGVLGADERASINKWNEKIFKPIHRVTAWLF